MAYENDILTRNDNDELAVRTVQSVGDNPASSYDDVYTRDNNGKLAVRVVGSGGGDSHNKGYFATQAALEEAYPTGEAGDYAIVGSTDTVWIWDEDNSEWVDTDTKGEVVSVNGKTGTVVLNADDVGAVPQYSSMPEPNQAGDIAQYIGEYDGTYKKGYFYKSVEVPGDVVSGNININFYWPQELTPPVVGSVDIDTFSAYLSQNGYAPVSSDPRIEITFQPGSNNILFAYNVDTSRNTINLPWTTLTTQAAEALFAPLGFDFDFSSVPTNGETAVGGYMPTGTVYVWKNINVQDGVAFYGYDPENFTFDDLGKVYCRSEFNENGVGFYKVIDASIDNCVSGYAKVNSFNWNTNPTDFPKVNIDAIILEDYFTNDNTPFDYTTARIEITVDDVEIEPGVNGYEIKIKHNETEDESTITVSTHTLEGIIQALENIGIYIDIDEVPNGIRHLNMDIPVEGTFQGDPIPVMGVLPEQLGQSGKFLITDGTDVSWGTTVENHTLVIKNSQSSMYGGYPNQITFYSKYNGSDGTGASIQSGNNGSLVLSASSIATTGAIYPSGSVNLGLDTQSGAWGTVYARNLGNRSSSYVIQIPEATAGVLAVQVSTMPTADSTRVGQIYQFIGATDANYTHGYFYECVSDGGNPATYSWSALNVQAGGGGSGSTATTGTLVAANWSSSSQTINVTGVTASNNVIVAPAPASQSDYTAAGIICSAQGAGTLTFTCQTTPSSNLTVNVLII